MAPTQAAQVPRSALTFSAEGKLGVRIVAAEGKVAFVPVGIVEDGIERVWLSGLGERTDVIVQGQDFVKEGESVEAVPIAGERG
jgi:multidrug efflux system membrane fusion protein